MRPWYHNLACLYFRQGIQSASERVDTGNGRSLFIVFRTRFTDVKPSLITAIETPDISRLGKFCPRILVPELERQQRISKRCMEGSAGCREWPNPVAPLPGVAPTVCRITMRC